MKKLIYVLTISFFVAIFGEPVFASEIREVKSYSTEDSDEYYYDKYEENYDDSRDYDEEVIFNDDNWAIRIEEDLDMIPAVSQFEDRICNHKNAAGKKWNDSACVATSISLMILRGAYLDGYDYEGDIYSKEAVIDVLCEISDDSSMFSQSAKNLYWQGNCYVDTLSRDGESFFAQIETHSANKENLNILLEDHPEGILVYGTHDARYHGVLVTKSFEDGTYEVYDSASGTVEYRDYTHLNGYKNTKYKFASLAS